MTTDTFYNIMSLTWYSNPRLFLGPLFRHSGYDEHALDACASHFSEEALVLTGNLDAAL